MGVQAIPVLIQAFEKVDSPWDRFWQWAYPMLPAVVRARVSPPVPSSITRGSAFMVFFENPKLKKNAYPQLLRHLENKSKGEQAQSYVLGLLLLLVSQDSTDAVAVVDPYLQANDPNVRRVAAMVLGQIGPSAKAAIPGLTVALTDADVRVRLAAASALWRIDYQTNVVAAVFEKEVASMDAGQLLVWAARQLSMVSPESPALLPAYIKALQAPKTSYEQHDFRSDFVARLANYGRTAEAAVPILVRIIREEPNLRSTALQTLKQIRPDEAKVWEAASPSAQ